MGTAVPHIFGRQLDAPGQQIAEFAELAQRIQQPGAQTIDMGATQCGGNQVHITLGGHLAALGQPLHRPLHRFVIALHGAHEWQLGQYRPAMGGLRQIIGKPVFVVPLVTLALVGIGRVVHEADAQTRAQHRLGAQHMLEAGDIHLAGVEVFLVGDEAHRGTRHAPGGSADGRQLGHFLTIPELHLIDIAIAADNHFEVTGQRVHHRHAHAMQTSGVFVILVRKLAARMQPREDQLDTADLLFCVHVHGHAAPVIGHLDEAVLLHDDGDVPGMARQGFIDAVVDDFLHEVIGPRGIGVHAWSLADRVQAGQYFDGIGIVRSAHCVWISG